MFRAGFWVSHRESGAVHFWKWWWSPATWFLMEQRGELLLPNSPMGHVSTGGMLRGGICSLEYRCSRRSMTLLLWSCKVGSDLARAVFHLLRGINACCYTKVTLCTKNTEKWHHLLTGFNHLSLDLASKELSGKKCICEVSTCKTWHVSEVWHCRWCMSEFERWFCC